MKILLTLTVLISAVFAQELYCPFTFPTEKFNLEKIMGLWYEIGHYRNAGATVWSENCFCSTSNVTKDPLEYEEGDSLYTYTCNLESATGQIQAFETGLIEMIPPGQWTQLVVPGFGSQSFTVVVLEESYALVHRCGVYDEAVSYTLQILSRKPTLDSKTIENMKAKVAALELNPEGAEYKSVSHEGCTYEGH